MIFITYFAFLISIPFSLVTQAQSLPSPNSTSKELTPPHSMTAAAAAPTSTANSNNIKTISSGKKIKVINDQIIQIKKDVNTQIGSKFIIIRLEPEEDEFQIIATGIVSKFEKDQAILNIKNLFLKKIPNNRDLAVTISEPKIFTDPTDKKAEKFTSALQEIKKIHEPGYIQLGTTFFSGNLNTTSASRVNAYKNIDHFLFKGIQLEWFIDFLPEYGFTYISHGGTFPVSNYYHESFYSSYNFYNLRFHYRPSRIGNWRLQFFIDSSYDEFSTENPDENLISSKYTTYGFGGKFAYEPGPAFQQDKSKTFELQRIFLEYSIHPKVETLDSNISRGASNANSNYIGANLGITYLVYLKSMPLIQNYFIEGGLGFDSFNLSFSGSTLSEKNGIYYTVPEGSSSKEIKNYYFISAGIRIEDFISKVFKPRN